MANESHHRTQGSPHGAMLLEPASDWPASTMVCDARLSELRGRTLANVTRGRSRCHDRRRKLQIIRSHGLLTRQQCDTQNKSFHPSSFQNQKSVILFCVICVA